MNPEGGTSGAIGTVATAAPVAGSPIGAGPTAEFGSGVGFDNGLATFSGLGRLDAFGTPSMGIPEGPVRGDIFSNTEIIASNPNLDSKLTSAIEHVSIFDNTSPFQATMPANEGSQPFSLKDTFVIAKPSEIESFVSSEPELAALADETIARAIEDISTNDPLVAYELQKDLDIAEKVIRIASEVTDKETAARISNMAIDAAVDRNGLVKKIEAMQKPEPESEAETEVVAQDETDVKDEKVDVELPDVEEDEADNAKVPERPMLLNTLKEKKFVRDEKANETRKSIGVDAVKEAFKVDVDPQTGKVDAEPIIARMKTRQTDQAQSKFAKELGVDDGSIPETYNDIQGDFENPEHAQTVIFQAINDNTGVEQGDGGIEVTEEEKAKVASGKKATTTDLPLAA